MPRAFPDQDFAGCAGRGRLRLEAERLGEVDEHVVVALDDIDGRLGLGDEVDRRKRFAHREHPFGGVELGAEGRLACRERANAVETVVLIDPTDEVGGRVVAGDGVDDAAGTVDRIRGLRVGRRAFDGKHQGEVAAGTPAGNADLIGVDTVAGGVGADKAHGALDVGHNLIDVEAGLGAVDDDEGGVACLGPAAVADAVVVRVPAAADDLDDGGAVGVRGLEDIHRQREAIALLVDHVPGAGGIGRGGGLGGCQTDGQEEGEEGAHGGSGVTPPRAGSCTPTDQTRNLMTTFSTDVAWPTCTPGWWPSWGRKIVNEPGGRRRRVVGPEGWAYLATSFAGL